jgi:hypothetical protein
LVATMSFAFQQAVFVDAFVALHRQDGTEFEV